MNKDAYSFVLAPSPTFAQTPFIGNLTLPLTERCGMQREFLSFYESECPSSDFFVALYDAGFACKPVSIINVGANKGYLISELLAIFAPHVGVTPPALGDAIRTSGLAGNDLNNICGNCGDCLHTPAPSKALSCPINPALVQVHAIEPVTDNLNILSHALVPLLHDANSVSLFLHRFAVVENQTATPSVFFFKLQTWFRGLPHCKICWRRRNIWYHSSPEHFAGYFFRATAPRCY